MTEPEFHYAWSARLRPHPLLRECTPYNERGGFRAAVEAVVFPKKKATGYSVLTSREYLEMGAELDTTAAAVRFNTDTIVQLDAADQRSADPFSIIWVPDTVRGDPEAVGQVHLIGPPWITDMMRAMVERSATPHVTFQSVLNRGERLNGPEARSTLRPTLSDTGLVRSVGIPPGRLRVVSRLNDELLKPRSTLTHEVVVAATVPNAINEAADLECEIAVFPKGWVTMRSSSAPSSGDVIELPVPMDWGRPPEGRTGLGSRYIFESLVARTRLGLVPTPPASRRPPSGRRGAEVRIRVLRGGVELCRLHHPFWIEPRKQASRTPGPPRHIEEELQHLLDLLNEADVARAAGVPVQTLRAWLQDAREPSDDEAERINDLSAIVRRLATVMNPDFMALWLRKPLRALDDEKPLDMLARDYKRVSRVVAALESPVAS